MHFWIVEWFIILVLIASYHLADAGIAGQDIGVLQDGQFWRSGGGDLQHAAPLGKVSTILLVLGASLIQSIQTCESERGSYQVSAAWDWNPLGWSCSFLTLGRRLAVGSSQGDDTFVDFDAHHHASFFEVVGERLAVVSLLVHSLMEEDDATDARIDAIISGEEELAVQPPVLLSVLSIDALEALCYAA